MWSTQCVAPSCLEAGQPCITVIVHTMHRDTNLNLIGSLCPSLDLSFSLLLGLLAAVILEIISLYLLLLWVTWLL